MAKELLIAAAAAIGGLLIWTAIGALLGFADVLRTHWENKDRLD